MKSKVTIEENETKIILLPENKFEESVLQNTHSGNYSIITKIKSRNDGHFSLPNERQLELILTRNSGEVNLYPALKERWNYQNELLKMIDLKLQSVKSTKTINEVKSLLAEWGNQPLQNF